MNKRLIVLFSSVLFTTTAIAQNAGPGGRKLPGTEFLGYFGVSAVQPDGTVKGNNPETVYSGATAVLEYEFSLESSVNKGMTVSGETCQKIEAELIKNERSLLKYFHKIPTELLKPQKFSSVVHNYEVKPHSVTISEVIGGTTASHTRCYLKKYKSDNKPMYIYVIGTYSK